MYHACRFWQYGQDWDGKRISGGQLYHQATRVGDSRVAENGGDGQKWQLLAMSKVDKFAQDNSMTAKYIGVHRVSGNKAPRHELLLFY